MQTMVIIGICGKMGCHIYDYYKNKYRILGVDVVKHPEVMTYHQLQEIKETIDMVVDFSSTDCANQLKEAMQKQIPVWSGTTGYELDQIEAFYQYAKEHQSFFMWKANYAKGIKLFSKLLEECKKEFHMLDFVEIHATTKKDAPSGTAKVLANELGVSEEKIQSIRMNHAPAIHEIVFSSDEERLILRHEIINKKAFLLGFDEELKKYFNEE